MDRLWTVPLVGVEVSDIGKGRTEATIIFFAAQYLDRLLIINDRMLYLAAGAVDIPDVSVEVCQQVGISAGAIKRFLVIVEGTVIVALGECGVSQLQKRGGVHRR